MRTNTRKCVVVIPPDAIKEEESRREAEAAFTQESRRTRHTVEIEQT